MTNIIINQKNNYFFYNIYKNMVIKLEKIQKRREIYAKIL